ncbi:hypothetical protein [Streptomyces sp. NPDC056165]|uniref:hypothetical protein n=1 Tax=Streptomyces sp. NPDC056165 TaxID=3345733 RepID=UPI0035E30122
MTATRWDKLPELLEANGGFDEWPVGMLVQMAGKQKAGAGILEDIERELAARNIGHLPPSLPRDSTRMVLLYNQNRFGLGVILHTARELAANQVTDGALIDQKVKALAMLLSGYQKASEDAAKAAQP